MGAHRQSGRDGTSTVELMPDTPARPSWRNSVLPGIITLVAIKGILLAVDPVIRIYLGDSAAFLYGAMDDGRLPDDRSFTYSFIIRALVWPFERLSLLGVWQTAAGVLAALLLWWLLERRFALPRRVAVLAACLLAIEPSQLYYERMVLAETFGLLAFVMFCAACAAYLSSGTWWWLPAAAIIGLSAASLRLNYLPVVLVISIGLPLLRLFERERVPSRQVFAHAVAALLAVVTVHGAYCSTVGAIFNVPPAYLARAGFMQLGLVVPLVKPHHLERVGLPRDIGKRLRYPLHAPDARMRHMWTPGGLIAELRRSRLDVERVARPLSRMAIADDPLGLLRLGLYTVGDYFREDGIRHALDNDLGRRPIPPAILWSLREQWGYDARGLPTRVTLVSWWFERGTWWLVASLFLLGPLAVLNVFTLWNTPFRVQALLAGLVGIGLVLSHVLFVPVAFYRYLHPLPFFLLLNAIPAAYALRIRLQGKAGRVKP